MGWLSSGDRKKHQRQLNRVVRAINKCIEEDELWRGRFVIRQKCAVFGMREYDVNDTCPYLHVGLEFRDKKTGQTAMFYETANSICFWNGHKLWRRMNDFIVKDCDVWRVDGREFLYSDKTDYTKVN